MNVAEARIIAACHRMAGVIKNPYTGRVFKYGCTIAVTQLAGVRTQRGDLDVLREHGRTAKHQRSQYTACYGNFHDSPLF